MRRERRFAVVATALAATTVAACTIGANPGRSSVATAPIGTDLTIRWSGGGPDYFGNRAELLAVADSGLFLLHGSTVVFYPEGTPASVRSRDARLGWVHLQDFDRIDLDELSKWARHPYGLSAELIERLLDALGQDSVTVRRD